MAIGTVVKRGENTAVDSGADLTVTLDQALTTGNMALCSVFIGKGDSVNPVQPTSVTGGGVTWTLHRTYAYDAAGTSRATLFLYRAYASAPSGTSVVVDYADTPARTVVSVVEWPGADTGGTNGADAFSATNIGEANGTANEVAAAMTTLASAGNAFLAVAVYTATSPRTWTPDASPVMSEIVDISTIEDAASNASGMGVFYNLGTADVNPTIGANAGAITQNAIVVFELIEAAAGPTIDTQPVAGTAVVNESTLSSLSFTVAATTSGGTLLYDWELETSVGGGVYANLANGNGATWTGQAAATATGTFTATTLTGRRVRVNVTDDNGTTTSDAVALTVYQGPVLVQPGVTNGSGVSTTTYTTDFPVSTFAGQTGTEANGWVQVVTATVGSVTKRYTSQPTPP